MTTLEQAALINTIRLLPFSSQDGKETISVAVRVIDVQQAFGRVLLVVEPVEGEGKMRVNMDRTKEQVAQPVKEGEAV